MELSWWSACLVSMHKVLLSFPVLGKLSMVVQAYNPHTRKVEAGFEASLECMRLYLKIKSKQNRKHAQVLRLM